MVTVKDIDAVLTALAPTELSESWDNDGIMLCKSKFSTVKKVLITLEVSKEGAEYAVNGGFDLIVTHHPFIFKPLSRITDDTYEVIEMLMKARIAVCSYHTRMDSSETGVNAWNAELLELENVQGFGGESNNIGRIGELSCPMSTAEFAEYLKDKFGCGTIRASLFKNPERKVKKVAVTGGAGKRYFREAYAAGADVYVTSEADHNTFIDCKELDMCMFDCGHYYTENPVCERFKNILKDSFADLVTAEIYDVGSPYVNI